MSDEPGGDMAAVGTHAPAPPAGPEELVWDRASTERGPDLGLLRVRYDWMRHPSRREALKRLVLESVDWVNCVALTTSGLSVMVEQYPLRSRRLHPGDAGRDGGCRRDAPSPPPSGSCWKRPATGAARGGALGAVEPNPAIHPHLCHHFLAEGVERLGEPTPGLGEAIRVHLATLEEIRTAMRDGRLRHVLALSALARVFDLFGTQTGNGDR